MVKPTNHTIASALKMLPRQPDASVILTSDPEQRYEETEVFFDLLAYGRVLGPAAEAEEAAAAGVVGRWEEAWRSAPLVIHDAGLLAAIDALTPDLADVSGAVSTAAIGGVLDEHPGPVGCLRVESSDCPPSLDVVGDWLDQLRAKNGEGEGRGAVGELVIMNNTEPDPKNEQAFFPLRRLPGSLRSLALGFWALYPLDADHLTLLVDLRLSGCSFCGKNLSALLPELLGLKILVLGCCCLTSGCGPEGLTVVSSTLMRLHMWSCTASGGVTLQYAPKFTILCTGVRPRRDEGGASRLRIDMRTAGALRELHGLMLYYHDLSYITPFAAKLKGRNIAPLPNLGVLRVCLQMSTPQQIFDLMNLLRHLPCLRELVISRVDDAHPAEESINADQEEAFNIPGVRDHLRRLVLHDFRGGAAEIAFGISVLAMASELAFLLLHPHPELPLQAETKACEPLLCCNKASPACQVVLLPN